MSGTQKNTENKESEPLLLQLREPIGGIAAINPQCSDDPTFMGATQGNGADYQSD